MAKSFLTGRVINLNSCDEVSFSNISKIVVIDSFLMGYGIRCFIQEAIIKMRCGVSKQ